MKEIMNMNRTHNNGELRITDVNKKVELIGWVAKKRNLGALVFVDLRDRHGITQVIFDESFNEQLKDCLLYTSPSPRDS